jgi:hypothetical protein
MLGGGGAKICPEKYNIDYFGYAVNLEFKFQLNFDQKYKKNLNSKKIEKKIKLNFAIIYKEKLI